MSYESGNYKVNRTTGSSTLSYTVFPNHTFKLKELRVHLGGAGTSGTLTVTVSSLENTVYNTVLFSQDMTSVTDLVWAPTEEINLSGRDKLVVSWANANSVTYGVELITEKAY